MLTSAIRCTVFVLTALGAVPILAQRASQPPRFQTGTDLVVVDFVVTDAGTRPVRGLTAKDFVVKENGRERPVLSFAAFDGGNRVAPESKTAPGTPAAPRGPQPVTAMLIDDGHLSPEQVARLKPALKALLATTGEHSGAVSIVAPWSKVSAAAELPSGAATLMEAVDRIVGQHFPDQSAFPISEVEAFAAERGDASMMARLTNRFLALNPSLSSAAAAMYAQTHAAELAHDSRRRRDALYSVALLSLDWLAPQPGRHSMVIVSPGFARETDDLRYQQVVNRSMRVNAPIHFVDVRGLQGAGLQSIQTAPAMTQKAGEAPSAWTDASDGTTSLAEDSGGISIRDANDLSKGFGTVMDSMATYYVLAYEPASDAKPGFRKITVDAKPRGLHVRARRGYFVDAPRR